MIFSAADPLLKHFAVTALFLFRNLLEFELGLLGTFPLKKNERLWSLYGSWHKKTAYRLVF